MKSNPLLFAIAAALAFTSCATTAGPSTTGSPAFLAQAKIVCDMINQTHATAHWADGAKHGSSGYLDRRAIDYRANGAVVDARGTLRFNYVQVKTESNVTKSGVVAPGAIGPLTTLGSLTVPLNNVTSIGLEERHKIGLKVGDNAIGGKYAVEYFKTMVRAKITGPAVAWKNRCGNYSGGSRGYAWLETNSQADAQRFKEALEKLVALSKAPAR